ncbi:MAG TPA: O-methyltransferase [Chthonomonadaceae bacterium]|nr:O-methyltransferase [Chthonomonadaceae bacterium]
MMPTDPVSSELIDYVRDLFAPEDRALQALMQAASDFGMPEGWEISPDVGRLFQVLCRATGAQRVVEFGTLAGYSALWLARALPADGRVISIEIDPEYAAFAREHLAKTEAGAKVEVRVGAALEMLPELEREVHAQNTPFDVVFLDADKEHYPEFLDWSTRVLRPGGLLLADNVLSSTSWGGQTLLDPAADDPRILAIREFNRRLAADPRFTAIIIPMRAGVAAAVFHP